jgi:hypothetical protein
MDKNTKLGLGVKSIEKKLETNDGLLGANQEFRRPWPRLLRDEPGGGIWTWIPASHEIGGCLPPPARILGGADHKRAARVEERAA